MLNLEDLKNTLKAVSSSLSITKYDLYGAEGSSTSVSVDSGKADKVTAKDTSSCVLRVWSDKNTGSVSTSDLTEDGLKIAFKTALDIAKLGLQDVTPDFSPKAKDDLSEKSDSINPKRPLPSDLIDKLIEMEKKAIDSHEAITRVPYNGISDATSREFYINSDGAFRVCEHAASYCYLYTLAQEKERRARKAFSLKQAKDFADLETDLCLKETIEKTIFSINYISLPKEDEYTVVFSPRAFLALFSSFSNIWNARSVLDQKSLSTKESIGQKIAVESFNFSDNALHKDNFSRTLFDQEGTPTRELGIIENGTLKTFIHNEETAKAFNTEPTGNAVIGARPSAGTNFYHIFSGDNNCPLRDKEKEKAIVYVEQVNALHAGVQSTQGTFSLPVDGWVTTDDGIKSFESAVVSGDIMKVLQNIVYMDPEPIVTENGVCPDIWVTGLKVTG